MVEQGLTGKRVHRGDQPFPGIDRQRPEHALDGTGLPAVEVHLSAVDEREEWRRLSVIRDLCLGTVSGKGPDGYREALELIAEKLGV